jgi:hypothetical protein
MEFEEVLEQTIALLQRQGRVSYGALKRRFKLDDADLEDLKVELIEAQQPTHDENGRILVCRRTCINISTDSRDGSTTFSHLTAASHPGRPNPSG